MFIEVRKFNCVQIVKALEALEAGSITHQAHRPKRRLHHGPRPGGVREAIESGHRALRHEGRGWGRVCALNPFSKSFPKGTFPPNPPLHRVGANSAGPPTGACRKKPTQNPCVSNGIFGVWLSFSNLRFLAKSCRFDFEPFSI